jgi:FkbM family methyltransferase
MKITLKKMIKFLMPYGFIMIYKKIKGKSKDVFTESSSREYSYSQDGEDIVLRTFFEGKHNYHGFYIDIGAHHPFRFSNTQYFYERGWHGINIDATPNSMDLFNKYREKDINLEIGVGDIEGELDYYLFEEPALNSFNKELSEERIKDGCKLKEIKKIKIMGINEILEEYVPAVDGGIDFISMDVEGFELKIIEKLNFDKYSPRFFLIEENDYNNKDFMEYNDSPIYKILKKKGYCVIAKTMRTVIYKKLYL